MSKCTPELSFAERSTFRAGDVVQATLTVTVDEDTVLRRLGGFVSFQSVAESLPQSTKPADVERVAPHHEPLDVGQVRRRDERPRPCANAPACEATPSRGFAEPP